jgi:serine protease Do
MEDNWSSDKSPGELSYKLVKRLVSISLVVGLVGGAMGGYMVVRYLPDSISTDRRQVVLEENSAVVDVVKKVSPSVVSITTSTTGVDPFFGRVTQAEGAGTGIILTEDGLILTNNHVASSNVTEFSVFTSDGKEHRGARVVARDPAKDVAFIRINAKGLKPAEIGDSGSLVVGQKVIAIGNALGRFQNTATEGIVSGLGRPISAGGGLERPVDLDNLIQTDAAINPGNSGGPLVNVSGQVVGINTAIVGGAQNIGFAIPIKEVEAAISSVKSQGKIVRPYLGVRYLQVTREFANRNNLKIEHGAYIVGGQGDLAVLPGSPAAKAGLREGDIILKFGDNEVNERNSLSSLISKQKVADKVRLTILRDEREQTVEVTLEEAPTQ